MNNKARQIWRKHTEDIFRKYKAVLADRHLLPNTIATTVEHGELADTLYKRFHKIEILLGEALFDWDNEWSNPTTTVFHGYTSEWYCKECKVQFGQHYSDKQYGVCIECSERAVVYGIPD